MLARTAFLTLVAAALLLTFVPAHVHSLAVWPQPALLTNGSHVGVLSSTFDIVAPQDWASDADFQSAVKRTLTRIKTQSIQPVRLHQPKVASSSGGSQISELQIRISSAPKSTRRDMQVFSARMTTSTGAPKPGVSPSSTQPPQASAASGSGKATLKSLVTAPLETYDESYVLDVPQQGGPAVLTVTNALAAVRGLATFSQLVYGTDSSSSGTLYIEGLPLHIEDHSAFPYRGVMLDSARNYLPPSTIKRQLDAMELLKINQLHWHITDTASWPLGLQSKGMNVMAQKGAYGPNKIYTKAVVEDLVQYAVQRGINIIIEIDMPGHQFQGVKDYPGDLIVCGDQLKWTDWGAEPPTGHLDIRKPAATQLMKDVFSELTQYVPGPYVSTGNDEVEAQCYGLQTGDTNGTDTILAPFVDAVHSHLSSLGKVPMVWEEAALNYPKTALRLKNGTLVEAWTGSANVKKLLKSNPTIRLVHAPVDFFYLDCGMADFVGNNPASESWCKYVSWQKQYSFDPLKGTHGIKNGAQRIMGGESALWAELVDEANVESLLWPRAAAGAEVFWTGANFTVNADTQPRSGTQALPRLHEARFRLRAMGLNAAPLQPFWCALRPGRCDSQS